MAQNANWPDLATALVAIYGAALSTYTLVKDRLDKRRILKVRLWPAIPFYESGAGKPLLMIGAVNPGERIVHVTGAGFKFRWKKGGLALFQPQSDVPLPHALEPGKGCNISIDSEDFARQLRELGRHGTVRLLAYVQDATGKQHFSSALQFDVDERAAAS